MNAIDELREQGKMTWIDEEHGWIAAPEDIVDALANAGFLECKRATTTSVVTCGLPEACGRESVGPRVPWRRRSG